MPTNRTPTPNIQTLLQAANFTAAKALLDVPSPRSDDVNTLLAAPDLDALKTFLQVPTGGAAEPLDNLQPLYLAFNFFAPLEIGGGSDGRGVLAFSLDGKRWATIGGTFVYADPRRNEDGTGVNLRDPYLIKYLGRWWIFYTRDLIATTSVFSFAVSDDLINWTYVQDVECGTNNGIWGPKPFIDPATGLLHIVIDTDPFAEIGGPMKLLHPTNNTLTTWSAPTNLGINGIDGHLAFSNGFYYLVYRNIDARTRLAKSSTVAGPYTVVSSIGNTWTDGGIYVNEAQRPLQKADGTWRIYFYRIPEDPTLIHYSYVDLDSDNLETGNVGPTVFTQVPALYKHNNGNRATFKNFTNGSVEHVTSLDKLSDIYAAIAARGVTSIEDLELYHQKFGPTVQDDTIQCRGLIFRTSSNTERPALKIYNESWDGVSVVDPVVQLGYATPFNYEVPAALLQKGYLATAYDFYFTDYLYNLFFFIGATTGSINFVKVGATVAVKAAANSKAGTFTMTEATPLSVGNTSITTGSVIVATLKTVGGTPGPFLTKLNTPTGFIVTGTAGDTSTYNYLVMEVN